MRRSNCTLKVSTDSPQGSYHRLIDLDTSAVSSGIPTLGFVLSMNSAQRYVESTQLMNHVDSAEMSLND